MAEAKKAGAVIPNEQGKAGYRPGDVITIDKMIVPEQANEAMEIAWHDLKSSQIKHKIISGILTGVEKISIGGGENVNVAIADYNGYRVMIPLSEMNIRMGEGGNNDTRLMRAAANMIGCEVDFIVTNTDDVERAVSASRAQAMKKKMNDFYIEPASSTGKPVIEEGSVVEARVIGVGETIIRLEVFGAECFVQVYDLIEEWVADAKDKFYVGQIILVRVKEITVKDNAVSVSVEAKSLKEPAYRPCVKQGRYLGEVTGVNKGTFFLRLSIGTNAVAHSHESCTRLPKKKDKVSFVCVAWDEQRHTAIGMITKIQQPYGR